MKEMTKKFEPSSERSQKKKERENERNKEKEREERKKERELKNYDESWTVVVEALISHFFSPEEG